MMSLIPAVLALCAAVHLALLIAILYDMDWHAYGRAWIDEPAGTMHETLILVVGAPAWFLVLWQEDFER